MFTNLKDIYIKILIFKYFYFIANNLTLLIKHLKKEKIYAFRPIQISRKKKKNSTLVLFNYDALISF